ncbi:MAG: hypothetical protein K5912_01680 [Alphaproteobacteria bacterium]|nr:hypothetical protein [Alphaproteobacteria bacterium]
MEKLAQSVIMLEQARFKVNNVDEDYIFLEDPACILRSLETFIDYATVIIWVITGALLFGWALSMIRGVKNDIQNNIKRLFLVFMIISAFGPLANLVFGGDLISAIGCKELKVSIEEVNFILEKKKLGAAEDSLFENIEIFDSGMVENAQVSQEERQEQMQRLLDSMEEIANADIESRIE